VRRKEATRLGPYHFGNSRVFVALGQQFNAERVGFRVFQQAGDIAEKNARFWIILDALDAVLQIFKLLCSCGHKCMPD
jgi:hypothetical protein